MLSISSVPPFTSLSMDSRFAFLFAPPHPLHLHLQSPNPNPNPISIPNPTSSSSLPTTISLLDSLLSLATTTLTSISSIFTASHTASALGKCPFDHNHRMPPESLFRHSLLCPSAPGSRLSPDLAFLGSLRYPETTRPITDAAPFLRLESDDDLCFSLEGQFEEPGVSFFYKGCPGVVRFPEADGSSRTFTLPAFLASECANVVGGVRVFEEEERRKRVVGLLPSEFWALRREVSAWTDFPVSYSNAVLRVASCLRMVEDLGLRRWVILNSPRFGVVVDIAMSDHVCLLLKLCLKAIEREAICSLELVLKKEEVLDSKDLSFDCQRLVRSSNWLASQLSVLYGEANGKYFAVGMVREAMLGAGLSLMLFRDRKGEDGCGDGVSDSVSVEDREVYEPKSTGNLEYGKPSEGEPSEGVRGKCVFVSQVAAAIAALHERFLFEEWIKAMRFGRSLLKTQLINEHYHISTRSSEVRSRRPDYKAVIEHDGLLWQRAQDQDVGKEKTREELLAEERDYKRRRMSYRGKKVKRTPIQVIRDIIEEQMEGIKQVGVVGFTEKVAPEKHIKKDTALGVNDVHSRNGTFERGIYPGSHRKQPQNEYFVKSGTHEDLYNKERASMECSLQKSYSQLDYEEGFRRTSEREKRSNWTSYSQLHEQNAHHGDQDYDERRRSKHDRNYDGYSSRSNDHQFRSPMTSNSAEDRRKENRDYRSEGRSRCRGRTSNGRRSESVTQDVFEDRYDPSASYDGYGSTHADFSTGRNTSKHDSEPYRLGMTKRRDGDHQRK